MMKLNPELNIDPSQDVFNKPLEVWLPSKQEFESLQKKKEKKL